MDDYQHKDAYPWTWEPAAAAAVVLGCIGVLSLQLGRSTALLVSGAGIWWPAPQQLLISTWGISQGNLAAGLPNTVTTTSQNELAWILAALFAAVMCAGGGWLLWRLRGHASAKGMASTEQATQLLGLVRLRKSRRIIRPDVYGSMPR
ncbi:hypothetical protein FOJ82_00405 [Tessaracoccus rhinocerotis]|uniref:Conjugal transfer protein n=1 Tax=Tessaracoccus rhinocerotis TaxID=1689449 RepID=A0A553K408_9ACTN|nr:hypothetical protein [Tessaracoccus rhinocerotis]TRY19414.1 hypothetical protein FOJ82_00405 [Tessaracoccus rhinocerotis]